MGEINNFYGIPAFTLRCGVVSLFNIKKKNLSDKKPFTQQTIYSETFLFYRLYKSLACNTLSRAPSVRKNNQTN